MSLYRRKNLGILNVSRFSNLSDSDLKDLVVSVKELFPDCGERIVLGSFGLEEFLSHDVD